MSDYKVINDNGYERTWEELYEDNVWFHKYADKLEKENQELRQIINKAMNLVNNEIYKNRCNCRYCNDYYLKEMKDILKEVE